MKDKLNCILLVDDDGATNFIHKMLLKQADCAKDIVAAENGLKAIEFLQNQVNEVYPQPDLILLDINMPEMNGWDFLEKYQELDVNQQGGKILLMITTALNSDDLAKAEAISVLSGFMNKPLTSSMVNELLQNHFEERL